MVDLEEFRNNARKENLCAEYTKKWDSCGSKKQLIDMALSSKGIDYLCCSISQGWGISPSVLYKDFSMFINGMYVSQQDGYDSSLFCNMFGNVLAETTVLGFIDCNVMVEIPKNSIVEIYCAGKCDMEIVGEGECVVISYGNPENTSVKSSCKNMKRIKKKDRDRYD